MCQHRSSVFYSLFVIAVSLAAWACSGKTASSPSTMGSGDSGTQSDSGTPGEDGGDSIIIPERRTTFVGRHKSLNYLFYLAARQYALDQGAKEALILEADGLVSEGAATSLIFEREGSFCTPQAPSALPGVTIKVLSRSLARRGQAIKYISTTPNQLADAEGLWLTNALMGVMPVSSLDGRSLPISPATGLLQECLDLEVQSNPRG